MKLIRFRLPLFRFILIFFFLLVLFSCKPSFEEGFQGEWISTEIKIKIDLKKKTIELQNFLNSKDSFVETIKNVEKNLDNKWLIELTANKKITLRLFNEDTMFLYFEKGYVRLKKIRK